MILKYCNKSFPCVKNTKWNIKIWHSYIYRNIVYRAMGIHMIPHTLEYWAMIVLVIIIMIVLWESIRFLIQLQGRWLYKIWDVMRISMVSCGPPTLCLRNNSTRMFCPSDILSHATIYYCYTSSLIWYIQGFNVNQGKMDVLSHVTSTFFHLVTNGTSTLWNVHRKGCPSLY